MLQRDAAILVAFSKGNSSSGLTVPSEFIFDKLMAMKRWYVPRGIPECSADIKIIFYEAKIGFRGYATIRKASTIDPSDRVVLDRLGVPFLKFRVEIDEIVTFEKPLPVGPHVDSLSFITNKKYWGNAFRTSPRLIPAADYRRIVHLALNS